MLPVICRKHAPLPSRPGGPAMLLPAVLGGPHACVSAEAARKMWKQQTGSLLVIDGDDLVGIITERAVLRAVATGTSLAETRISEIMSKDIITVAPGASLREALSGGRGERDGPADRGPRGGPGR
jgi:CBS-domain-containing membrane protein